MAAMVTTNGSDSEIQMVDTVARVATTNALVNGSHSAAPSPDRLAHSTMP